MPYDSEIFYQPEDSPRACHERELPTDTLKFNNGERLFPARLRQQNSQCVQSTTTTKLFESAPFAIHYWYSRDMAWWVSAARQVFHDAQALLTKGDPDATPFTHLCTPNLLRHPESAKLSWLSCFVRLRLHKEGSILHPARGMVRTPCDETGLPDTLRFDVFLLECWSRMDLDSQEDMATLQTINKLQADFDRLWKKCVATHEKYEKELRKSEPRALDNVTGCLFLPEPKAHSHVRSNMAQVQEKTGCTIKVPLNEDEPVQITGTKERVEKAKRLILDMLRKNLMNIDDNRDFTSARSQYLAAKRKLCELGRGEADGSADSPDGEATNGDGDQDGEETRLARDAAQNQLRSAQLRLQIMAYAAVQTDAAERSKVIQAFGQLFCWDRRAARDQNREVDGSSASSE
ncbi:hypothetical protein VSDG_05271 [Cytospora chrysosperma]|uniref:K Homology domain-containing protein n=1 Tax=Cytospora chrysosperma TaxID=252740 RepID=A0A423VX02_CYTCH|nr:hypothetical protein VSDG_05271 [Valsa sordida]